MKLGDREFLSAFFATLPTGIAVKFSVYFRKVFVGEDIAAIFTGTTAIFTVGATVQIVEVFISVGITAVVTG